MSSASLPSDGRVFLITGANKGLGFTCIEQLLESDDPKSFQPGKDVILLAARSVANGAEAIKKLQSKYGDKAKSVEAIQLDVTDKASIAAAVKSISERFGRVDRLIQNAGIARYNFSSADAKAVLETNLYGLIDLDNSIVPLLRKSPDPKEIVVSSEVGAWCVDAVSNSELRDKLLNDSALSESEIRALAAGFVAQLEKTEKGEAVENPIWPVDPRSFYGGYGVSKALVSAYSRSFAARNDWITVAIVTPGYCATDLNNNSGPRSQQQGAKSILYGFEISRGESGKGLLFDTITTPFVQKTHTTPSAQHNTKTGI